MVKQVFCDILRSELNNAYSGFPCEDPEVSLSEIDNVVLDCAQVMLNQLFAYSSRSDNVWRMIVK